MASYIAFILAIGGIYALLALSLNLVWGAAGMVNLGLAGFFAVGGYTTALLTTRLGVPVPFAVLSSLITGAATGLLLTIATRRLRDEYLAIVTLGFAEALRLVAANETWLTGGTDGIAGVPQPFKAQFGRSYDQFYLILVLCVVTIVFLVLRRLDRSPYGRTLKAIRENPEVAAIAGKNSLQFKLQAFALSGAIAALAGALYAHFVSYIAPDLYQPLLTIYIFLGVTAGGLGRPAGALLGAYLVISLLESVRFIGHSIPILSALQVAAAREILVGVMLLWFLSALPGGLLPERIAPAPRPEA
jgi:branched-chain amino acid transport system permease protein